MSLIRHAKPDEADALTALAQRAKAHWGYSSAWMDAWRSQLTIAPDYIARHRVLVAELAGRLAGMCALEDKGPGWSLENVWVDPAHIGHGVGRALVQHALQLAASARPGPVMVESDPNAAGFYRQLGAREVGTVAAAMPGAPDRVLPVFEFRLDVLPGGTA